MTEERKSSPKSKCCGKTCPFASEEGVQNFVEMHADAVINFQSMIFFHRPIPMAILIIAIDLLLFYIGKANLGFLPVLTLLVTFYLSGKIIIQKYGDQIRAQLFPPIDLAIPTNEPNHICSNDEVASFIWKISQKIQECRNKKIEYTPANIAILLGISTTIFIITNVLTTLGVFAIVIHVLLLGPGIIFNPAVYPHIAQPLHLKAD